jgi:predicted RNA-binding Zn ribbon-like protein
MSRSTKRNPDWKDGFLFIGNQLALDFLNTRPVMNGQAVELLPDFSALLRWCQAADLLSSRHVASLQKQWGNSARARRTLKAAWKLRERLRNEVLAWEGGTAVRRPMINELNRLMLRYPMRSRLKATRNVLSRELLFEAKDPEDLFAPLAHSAATLFAEVSRDRVRKCGQCVLHFQDTSKKGTRRWCSMRLCGNRLKVAAYAARHRALRSRSTP